MSNSPSVQSKVGAHIVGELDQFDFIAFFLQSWLDLVFYHIAEAPAVVPKTISFFSAPLSAEEAAEAAGALSFDHRRQPVRWRAQRLKGF